MLINVRDSNGNLKIKDILDLDFDMHVEEDEQDNKLTVYKVMINSKLCLDDKFYDRSSAEEKMLSIANARNELENELRNF